MGGRYWLHIVHSETKPCGTMLTCTAGYNSYFHVFHNKVQQFKFDVDITEPEHWLG